MSDLKYLVSSLCDDYWKNIKDRDSLDNMTKKAHWVNALQHFIEEYAYERNVTGAARKYSKIATETIKEFIDPRAQWTKRKEGDLWRRYCTNLKKEGVNPNNKVDPLLPSSGKKINVVSFAWNYCNNQTICAWASNMMKNRQSHEAYQELKKVWGIGPKIAAFYLRDVYWLSNELKPKQISTDEAWLLQPIDIWIERALFAAYPQSNETNVTMNAQAMVVLERELSLPTGSLNIAFWNLGANFATSREEFESIVKIIVGKNTSSREFVHVQACARNLLRYAKIGVGLERLIKRSIKKTA